MKMRKPNLSIDCRQQKNLEISVQTLADFRIDGEGNQYRDIETEPEYQVYIQKDNGDLVLFTLTLDQAEELFAQLQDELPS